MRHPVSDREQALIAWLQAALQQLDVDGVTLEVAALEVKLTRAKDQKHGDYATNIALVAARQAGVKPHDLAAQIVQRLAAPEALGVTRVEIAGPGFINLFLNRAAQAEVVTSVLKCGESYGRATERSLGRVQVEFVSSNPTGPLHIGHGRGAAFGAALANLLEAAGYDVEREYYVNDGGRQVDILSLSIWLRYLEIGEVQIVFPAAGYQGGYIAALAEQLRAAEGGALERDWQPVQQPGVSDDSLADALVVDARTLLGDGWNRIRAFALEAVLGDIRADLAELGVHFQHWFHETSIGAAGLAAMLERVPDEYLYERDAALWLRTTAVGGSGDDDKDRVLRRENGEYTYFAWDLAYHLNKFERGYDRVINVWGADHHGYVPRVKQGLQALGIDPERLEVLLVQFANLYRGGEKLKMSTRSGQFITLRELREEVGRDATRFFYAAARSDQHMDFDLDLARSETRENPVYYVQYAHARVCSLHRKLAERGLAWDRAGGLEHLDRLSADVEQALMSDLTDYPGLVLRCAAERQVHRLPNYLRTLAARFHGWYNDYRMLEEDADVRNARVCLAEAVRQVIGNGMGLLGVSVPERM